MFPEQNETNKYTPVGSFQSRMGIVYWPETSESRVSKMTLDEIRDKSFTKELENNTLQDIGLKQVKKELTKVIQPCSSMSDNLLCLLAPVSVAQW